MEITYIDISILLVLVALTYIYFFHKPDHTPDPEGRTTNDDVVAPGNPSFLKSFDDVPVFTREHLRKYDGEEGRPIYIGIGGLVFDCSENIKMYGPGGPYSHFRGRDISKAAAKFSTTDEFLDDHDLTALSLAEKDSLKSFFNMLYGKYKIVARLA